MQTWHKFVLHYMRKWMLLTCFHFSVNQCFIAFSKLCYIFSYFSCVIVCCRYDSHMTAHKGYKVAALRDFACRKVSVNFKYIFTWHSRVSIWGHTHSHSVYPCKQCTRLCSVCRTKKKNVILPFLLVRSEAANVISE
jgi:hypothetical protein